MTFLNVLGRMVKLWPVGRIFTFMKILSNDYTSNLPHSKITSKGGPANFAELLTRYITSNTNHRWVGLLIESVKNKSVETKKLLSLKQRDYYALKIPRREVKMITEAKKNRDPEVIFKKPIEQIIKLIRNQGIDIIFLNGFSIYNWMFLKAGEATQTPMVIQRAGIWSKELDVYKNLYSAQGRSIMKKMEKESSALVEFEIFLNFWSRNVYRKEVFNVKDADTAIIHLPISDSKIKLAKKKKGNSKELKIGVVARWDKIKNYEAVLALAKEVKRRKLPWEVYSVISIPKTKINYKFKQDYKKFINVEPLKNRKEMSVFYRKMDLIIVPSNFDVSPHVVLESIFNGTPALISPNVGWVADYRSAGAKDWIVGFENPAKVVARIKKISNRQMPHKLIKNIRKETEPKRCLNKYVRIFKKFTKK